MVRFLTSRPTACRKPAQGKRGTSAALGLEPTDGPAPTGRNRHGLSRPVGAGVSWCGEPKAARLRRLPWAGLSRAFGPGLPALWFGPAALGPFGPVVAMRQPVAAILGSVVARRRHAPGVARRRSLAHSLAPCRSRSLAWSCMSFSARRTACLFSERLQSNLPPPQNGSVPVPNGSVVRQNGSDKARNGFVVVPGGSDEERSHPAAVQNGSDAQRNHSGKAREDFATVRVVGGAAPDDPAAGRSGVDGGARGMARCFLPAGEGF